MDYNINISTTGYNEINAGLLKVVRLESKRIIHFVNIQLFWIGTRKRIFQSFKVDGITVYAFVTWICILSDYASSRHLDVDV